MTQDYLAPFWQLLFAASMLVFLFAAVKWRAALYAERQYLPLVVLFMFPLGFFFLSRALDGGSLSRGTPMLMIGTGVLFVAAVLLAFLISKLARNGSGLGAAKQ